MCIPRRVGRGDRGPAETWARTDFDGIIPVIPLDPSPSRYTFPESLSPPIDRGFRPTTFAGMQPYLEA